MKNHKIYLTLFGIFIVSTCLSHLFKTDNAQLAGFYDISYTVEYSKDSSFSYISESFEFYNRVHDKYLLQPKQIDVDYWISRGGSWYKTPSHKYARITAKFEDSIVVITGPSRFGGVIITSPFKNMFSEPVKPKKRQKRLVAFLK